MPEEGIVQFYLTNSRTSTQQCTLMGTRNGISQRLDLNPSHRNTVIRVHDNSSYPVERFWDGTSAADTNSIIFDSQGSEDTGWYKFVDHEETESGYRLRLLNTWEEEVFKDVFPEERVDRYFIGWYNSQVYARRAERNLRDFTGHSRQTPIGIVLDTAYAMEGSSSYIGAYWDAVGPLANLPVIRQM